MTLDEFVVAFAEEFDDTDMSEFKADTEFKTLDEWSSLVALSIIAMVDDQMDKIITGADIRGSKTIEDLYNLALTK